MDLSRLPADGVRVFLGLLAVLALSGGAEAAPQVVLPLNRAAYQTNEVIELAVVRASPQPLPAGTLVLRLTGKDGSAVSATFAVPAVAVRDGQARATEHLRLAAGLPRPGAYTLEVAVDGGTAAVPLEVVSHLRKSDFKLINWGRAQGKEQQLVQGEDSLGFNLFYAHYGRETDEANFLRAGLDVMSNCTMGGAHQMDLRQECDWSDPRVSRGGTVRVVQRALEQRTRGNVTGVHFYDEPGLTWHKHPATGEFTPHGVPAQVRAYVAAFGQPPPEYQALDSRNPEHVARWRHWATWKLGFMDAAWKEAQFGVSHVRPDLLSVTQSQYGWSAFTDGYYFNVVRSLPVTSGHGGYDDFGPGYFNPSYFLEMARARDRDKPCWYLPTWYGNTPSDRFRLEQYLSFQTGVQGMMSPPDLEPAVNAAARQGIVESNHLMQKLGPIFTTLPPNKPPVAMLYSLSQAIRTQTLNRQSNYVHDMPQGRNLPLTYLAGKLLQQQFLPVLDEDVLDGTLAADHKAVVLTSLDYLDPKVVRALEEFAAGGGRVLLTGDCTVAVKGAVKLAAAPKMPDQAKIDELMAAKKYNELGPFTTVGKHLEGAKPLAEAIRAELEKSGIRPPVTSDVPSIVVTRHAAGDVEYLFVVNATHDGAKGDKNGLRATAARLTLEGDGRAVYDAVVGGAVPELRAAGGQLTGEFRFGPGQVRVLARTARPVGGVRVAAPVLRRELARDSEPIRVEIAAGVVTAGEKEEVLSGSIPLHIRVIDPLGVTRHELYRATRLGQVGLTLPLAANDPAGTWTVAVRELLSGREGAGTFAYTPATRVAALTGREPRAVAFGNERDNLFRFARLHRQVTIVPGTSAWEAAAVERLKKVLEPWGVTCQVLDVAAASKPRTLSAEEAATWIGLEPSKATPGASNNPAQAGFALAGHAILLGNPEDHAMIKYLHDKRFLPYAPKAGVFPGSGRGMMAWQRDGIGHGQESVTLIAHDADGLAEAVGSFAEAVAGMAPLTRWEMPEESSVQAARSAPGRLPAAAVAWVARLPDRVVGLKADGAAVKVLSHDGTVATMTGEGKEQSREVVDGARREALEKEMAAPPVAPDVAKAQARPDRMVKLAAAAGDRVAVAYWGGTLRLVEGGKVKTEQQMAQDVTALAWREGKLAVGLADGQVLLLQLP